MRFAVLADDLTGSNASAGDLAMGIGRPVSVLHTLPRTLDGLFVLNSRSREDSSRSALIGPWVNHLWRAGYRDFDKRIDTTLRGPGPMELNLLIRSLPEDPWVGVVAAYPSAGRTTRDGRQYLYERPVSEALSEVAIDDLGPYLFPDGPMPVKIRRELLHQDIAPLLASLTAARRVCFDVGDEEDLSRVGRILHRIRKSMSGTMVTVSSGALLRYYPGRIPERIAVIVGSPTATNLAQIEYLCQRRPIYDHFLGDPIVFSDLPDVVLLHSGRQPIQAEARQPISRSLAESAANRLLELEQQGWTPERFIITGGEMAQAFLDQVEANAVEILRLPSPLVGQGVIRGGAYSGCEIVTKGGLVGDRQLLHQLVLAPAIGE